MAVTATFTRIDHNPTVPLYDEVVTATLSGTYVTGGFTWNPFAIVAGPGTSPTRGKTVRGVWFESNTGYTYATTVSGSTATTKIYTNGATELTNGTTVPDTSLTVIITKSLKSA